MPNAGSVTGHVEKPDGRILRGSELSMTCDLLVISLAEVWFCS